MREKRWERNNYLHDSTALLPLPCRLPPDIPKHLLIMIITTFSSFTDVVVFVGYLHLHSHDSYFRVEFCSVLALFHSVRLVLPLGWWCCCDGVDQDRGLVGIGRRRHCVLHRCCWYYQRRTPNGKNIFQIIFYFYIFYIVASFLNFKCYYLYLYVIKQHE